MIHESELLDVKKILSAEEIDDSEEIMNWFAVSGIELIDEILSCRHATQQGVESTQTIQVTCPRCTAMFDTEI